jgi:uncharacterized delta-60 repeat protein
MKKPVIIVAVIMLLTSITTGIHAQVTSDRGFGNNGGLELADRYLKFRTVKGIICKPDGAILIAGAADSMVPNTRYVVGKTFITKVSANGNVDQSFGVNGFSRIVNPLGSYNIVNALATDAGNNLFLSAIASRDLIVFKRDSIGNSDNTFGLSSSVTKSLNSDGIRNSIATDSQNRILQVGSSSRNIALIRYLPNGTLDSTFGTNGIVATQAGNNWGDYATDVAVQPDGKIIICGQASRTGPTAYDFVLVRYLPNGMLDTNFGSNGITFTDFGYYDKANALAIQPDGKIVVTGEATYDGMVVARYLPDGALDTSFNHTGYLLKDNNGLPLRGNKVLVQPDGKIVVGGNAYVTSSGNDRDFAVFRCLADGTPDAGFAPGGLYTIDLSNGGDDELSCLALQPDGKVLLGGSAAGSFALIRLTMKELAVPGGPGKDQGYVLFPNPAGSEVFIQQRGPTRRAATIKVLDITGRVLTTAYWAAGVNQLSLPVTGFASGSYIVVVKEDEKKEEYYRVRVK